MLCGPNRCRNFSGALASVDTPIAVLFNEELGSVLQVRQPQLHELQKVFGDAGFPLNAIYVLGTVNGGKNENISFHHNGQLLYAAERAEIQRI